MDTIDEKKPIRKYRQLRVPVLPSEEQEIKNLAANSGLPVAAYLRQVGLGYRVRGIVDNKAVEQLVHINADLGRLGGLLKLWLSDDPRAKQFNSETIRAVLRKIESTQNLMQATIKTVIIPGAKR